MTIASRIDALRAQIDGPRDGALLRYALGAALLENGDALEAATQLRAAVEFDAHYSAAWKLLGKACLAAGNDAEAATAWQRGLEAANAHGDVQAAKEMKTFLQRLLR